MLFLDCISHDSSIQLQCTWEAYYARRNRGENLITDQPPKHIEAFHRLLIQYHLYSTKLEALLDNYVQTNPYLDSQDFRLERPKDPDDLLGLSLSLDEFHLHKEEEEDLNNAVECDDELESPTNILLWHDLTAVCKKCCTLGIYIYIY